MPHHLEFTEAQLCELWEQHTSLEDDPRDVNDDLILSFVDDDASKQAITVSPDSVEGDPVAHATFERVRTAPDAAWSTWARVG